MRTPEVLARGHALAEAPVRRPDGTIFFSDVLDGGVHVLHGDGASTTLLPDRRGIGGMAQTNRRQLVVSGRDLTVVDDSGRHRTVAPRPDRATGLNDLTVAPDGSVIVGLLTFRPFGGDAPTPGLLGRLAPGDEEIRPWGGFDLTWPNGIVVTDDGTVVAADFHEGTLWRGTFHESGCHLERFATLPGGHADGMALDRDGMVWVAGGQAAQVVRLTIDGRVDATIQLDEGFVSSVAFGAPGELLVTRATDAPEEPSLLRLAVDAVGAPIPLAAVDPA